MQTMVQTEVLGTALWGIAKPIVVRVPEPAKAEPHLFESMTRKRAHDGAALGVVALLYLSGLAIGAWMTLEVGKGLALAERCNGACATVDK